MNKENNYSAVQEICANHQIEVKSITATDGSGLKNVFIVNQEWLLRLSEKSMTAEQEKFERVVTQPFVPKIAQSGVFTRYNKPLFYLLLTLLPGDDFVHVFYETNEIQQKQLGLDLANFLDGLQKIKSRHYDIGLYEPAIPHFSGSWCDGHQKYWERLKDQSKKLSIKPESLRLFENAFHFLAAAESALDFQTGPVLLHNDLHPKNILLNQGKFSGVIDWECSQFGEADFELCHLIHWCVFPPENNINFRPFLQAFFAAAPKCVQVPHLEQRLTIYQIEHEIQQIIWHGSAVETWRIPRLKHWLDGGVARLFKEISVQI